MPKRLAAFLFCTFLVPTGAEAAQSTLASPTSVAPTPVAQPSENGAAQAPALGKPSHTETVGDWTLRCFDVKSQAPCDIIQVSVAKDNEQQRVLSASFAYIPDSDKFGMQIIVPLGIAVQKGLALGKVDKPLLKIPYSRCEDDGCYVEALVDNSVIDQLGALGDATTVSITPYGKQDGVSLNLSLKGFTDAIAKLKPLARAKAVPASQASAN